jgi:hypothetical protein
MEKRAGKTGAIHRNLPVIGRKTKQASPVSKDLDFSMPKQSQRL